MGFSDQHYGPLDQSGLKYLTVPIKDGSKMDYERSICVCIARTLPEFKEAVVIFRPEDALPEYEKYDEAYFRDHVLLIMYGWIDGWGGWTAESVTISGAELCIGLSDRVRTPGRMYPCVAYFNQQGLEISKDDFDGVDTISIFDRAINTK